MRRALQLAEYGFLLLAGYAVHRYGWQQVAGSLVGWATCAGLRRMYGSVGVLELRNEFRTVEEQRHADAEAYVKLSANEQLWYDRCKALERRLEAVDEIDKIARRMDQVRQQQLQLAERVVLSLRRRLLARDLPEVGAMPRDEYDAEGWDPIEERYREARL